MIQNRRPVVFWAGKGGVIGWAEPEGEGFGAWACSGGAFPAASRPSHRPGDPDQKETEAPVRLCLLSIIVEVRFLCLTKIK